MNPELKTITDNVYFISTKDPHRPLFDNLMPLEEGTSYNAYIIKGNEKTALIDTTYPPFINDFASMLENEGITSIDYIISLHGEQDHSGALPELLKKFPNAKIVTNQKCKDITIDFLPLKDSDYIIVEDNATLDLGGKTIKFMMAPWVHWPDTMFAHLQEDEILFSTDFFGAHATNFDKFWQDDKAIIPLLKSYYAEIMMPYATFVKKHLATVKSLNPKMIAPAHGPIYQKPEFVIDLYEKWTSDEKQKRIVLLGVTMYGSTQKMIDYVIPKFKEKGFEVAYHDAVTLDVSEFSSDLVDGAGLIVASPTVLSGPHPGVVSPCYLVNLIKPEVKAVGIFGSFSWGGTMGKQLAEMLKNLRTAEFIEPVLAKGTPKENDFKNLDEMVEKITKACSG